MELKIDVDELLRSRAPGYYKWIPSAAIRALERYVCQDELNHILRETAGLQGAAFARALLGYLNIDYSVESGEENLPEVSTPVTYVSNHPLGALDGVCLIDWVTKRHGCEPAFVVNDLLTVIKPLNNVFIPINKHGRQSRGAVSEVDAAFADLGRPVIMFPAGMCSRQLKPGTEIADLKWNKMFVQKSSEAGRTIVPLRFMGRNSDDFYRLARRREKLGMKFNLEMIRLPREMVEAKNSSFGIRIGTPIPAGQLMRGHEATEQAKGIREYIYTL
ncbi:MAG: 1-acyl-sn-glycerol-3-phosphate acyltransferase [Bacteroides sp.]|nr:1-acyl-sn-glycerol-3-phosphate acyltransferase [Bacteroides sp.]MCM1380168.1 1-acyl-sn-glycerol-3-phosphate acyltransferase [Bacteroides sp.]MCM1446483.1 1-acyl-sn-glycerol-3-phosphate acyltransferase [Prevotella sp.]